MLAYSHEALADTSPCLQARAFLFASRYNYLNQEIKRIESTMTPEEIAAMESSIRADLKAKGVQQYIFDAEIRIKRETQLANRAGVLPYEEWRKQQT